jgi:hypothetical protein
VPVPIGAELSVAFRLIHIEAMIAYICWVSIACRRLMQLRKPSHLHPHAFGQDFKNLCEHVRRGVALASISGLFTKPYLMSSGHASATLVYLT